MRIRMGIAMVALVASAAAGCNSSDAPDPTIPALLATLDGAPQTGDVGTVAPLPLRVIVKNAAGDPVADVTVHWDVTEGGGTVSTATSTSSNGGIAAVNFTFGSAGRNVVNASVAGLPGSPQSFVLVGTTPAGGGGGGL